MSLAPKIFDLLGVLAVTPLQHSDALQKFAALDLLMVKGPPWLKTSPLVERMDGLRVAFPLHESVRPEWLDKLEKLKVRCGVLFLIFIFVATV